MSKVKLTEYSHGAGCGCKIAPNVLEEILKTSSEPFHDPLLLVGNETKNHTDDFITFAKTFDLDFKPLGQLVEKTQSATTLITII